MAIKGCSRLRPSNVCTRHFTDTTVVTFQKLRLQSILDVPSRSNRFGPNTDITEVPWCTTGLYQHQLSTSATCPRLTDGCFVSSVLSAHDQGTNRIARCVASSPICQIRRSVPTAMFQNPDAASGRPGAFPTGLQ